MKHKKIILLITAIILILLGGLMNLPEERITFNFAENMGMWMVSEGSSFSQEEDSIRLNKGRGPLYVVVPQINVDADYYGVCIIEGSWPIAYDQGNLLFISPYNRQFDYNFRYDYDTGKANRINRRYIDLRQHGAWQGIVKAVLVLPATNATQVSLSGISFVHANPWTKIKAWWSNFTRYLDPKLGTCFAMATPIFMGKLFNPFFVYILCGFLVIGGVIFAGVHFLKADDKIAKITVGVCLAVFIASWALLDLRNNVVYLKAISRNISLYWGKSMQEKRGIVVGDPEFIDFMKFCDETIPLDANIFNQIADELPGTPVSYLTCVQYWANLKPRFPHDLSRSYYIFYKPLDKENWEVRQEQPISNEYLDLVPGEKVLQEIKLWQPSKYLSKINIWIQEKDIGTAKIELLLLSRDRKIVVGRAKFVSQAGKEAIFRFFPEVNFNKNEKVFLQIENKGATSVGIGTVYGEQYREGSLIRAGKNLYSDLSFRLVYRPKDLALFKRFNDEAYILADPEERK